MAGEIILNVVGNLTADPEVRQVGGANVATFTIAHTARSKGDNGEWVDGATTFVRCSAWRELADHVAASLTKGVRVMAQGRYGQRDYETREGEKRTSYELQVDEIGPSLRYATTTVTRAGTNRNQQARREQYAQQDSRGGGTYGAPQPRQEPQASGGWGHAGYDEEAPF